LGDFEIWKVGVCSRVNAATGQFEVNMLYYGQSKKRKCANTFSLWATVTAVWPDQN